MAGLLRFCTAGSVDDGKSTLVGRLLHDSRGVYEDQIHAITHASRDRGVGEIDFSLFTDGLRAEREQGITIDVAYRYFATARRSFILADTPGHEEYTRNMATGASTADLAVLLVDARQGLRDQTRRHARIAGLLGVRAFVLAVNKMDLVDFSQSAFDEIVTAFKVDALNRTLQAIPLSALQGDNVITRSERTPWYSGPSLLEHLETVDVGGRSDGGSLRFPVQLILRTPEFRGCAGQVTAGRLKRGDIVTVWPSGRSARVARIVTWDGERETAEPPASVAVELHPPIDVGRGDLISVGRPHVARRFEADVVWMDERPLACDRPYLLKLGTKTVLAELDRTMSLNQIARVCVKTAEAIPVDLYESTRATGSFIVIDPATHFTSGAGMVASVSEAADDHEPASSAWRLARLARTAATEADAVVAVERALELARR